MIQIGTTETYDPAFVMDWDKKLLDTNIIITKRLDDDMIKKLVYNERKVIVHHTITGQGGTYLEPNVETPEHEFLQFQKLISKISISQYVLRVDPIIPFGREYLDRVEKVLKMYYDFLETEPPFKIRCRVSVIDLYPHVIERFESEGHKVPWKSFHAPAELINHVGNLLGKYSKHLKFESCAEPLFNKFDYIEQIGCVSKRDFEVFGEVCEEELPKTPQRSHCLCLAKKNILGVKPSRCPHQCLYCYWKT